MRRRDLIAENRRLVAEVSYLRGRIEELQRAPAEVVGHVREIVTDTLKVFTPPEPVQSIAPSDPGMDWTDQLAPRTIDFDDLSAELNDRLVIADELDRDP